MNIKFNRPTRFLGRNGLFKATGISVWKVDQGHEIYLEPITSKGKIGRCSIILPFDSIDEVIEALSKIDLDNLNREDEYSVKISGSGTRDDLITALLCIVYKLGHNRASEVEGNIEDETLYGEINLL